MFIDLFFCVAMKVKFIIHIIRKCACFHQLPIGNKDRLLKVPSLVGNEFSFNGVKDRLAVADIQLSSLGKRSEY